MNGPVARPGLWIYSVCIFHAGLVFIGLMFLMVLLNLGGHSFTNTLFLVVLVLDVSVHLARGRMVQIAGSADGVRIVNLYRTEIVPWGEIREITTSSVAQRPSVAVPMFTLSGKDGVEHGVKVLAFLDNAGILEFSNSVLAGEYGREANRVAAMLRTYGGH